MVSICYIFDTNTIKKIQLKLHNHINVLSNYNVINYSSMKYHNFLSGEFAYILNN